MSRDSQFLARWKKEQPIYKEWGEVVGQSIKRSLEKIITPVKVSDFLKLDVTPRLKDDKKLLEKAFYRNKTYKDPLNDITDKVGIRFVVLLGSDVKKVSEALQKNKDWTFSKDRDYELEQAKNPLQFTYAAVHYIVRNRKIQTTKNGIKIPAGTACEVQIKTLLQHAYSELSHDTLYKPQIDATAVMQRNAAKAMALLEATNDYFEKVAADVVKICKKSKYMTMSLSEVYLSLLGIEPEPTILEGMLMHAYDWAMEGDYIPEIKSLLTEHPFIAQTIIRNAQEHNPIFVQPSILLVYYALTSSPRKAKKCWPLTPMELEPILNDLGDSLN